MTDTLALPDDVTQLRGDRSPFGDAWQSPRWEELAEASAYLTSASTLLAKIASSAVELPSESFLVLDEVVQCVDQAVLRFDELSQIMWAFQAAL